MIKSGSLIFLVFFILSNCNDISSIKENKTDQEFNELLADTSPKKQTQQNIQDKLTEQARSYYEEGLALYNLGKYLLAEEAFSKAIKLSERTEGDEIFAYSYHYLGNIESWKSNFSHSIQFHKKAKQFFYKLDNSEYSAISNNSIALGFKSLGNYDSAIVYYEKNIDKRDAIDEKYTVINSYISISVLYAGLYNYKLAYSYLQEGIKYAEKTGSKSSLAKIYFAAGQLFLNNHVNKDIALEYLFEAQSIFSDLKKVNYLNWVEINIGDVYYKTGNDSLAMYYYKEVSKKLGPNDYTTNSVTNHKIGMVYKKREEYDSALVYLQKSIDGMCLVCPEILIHETLIEAGRTYIIIGNVRMGGDYLEKAKNIAVKSKSGLEMVISFEELAKYYKAIHEEDSTLYYLNKAYKLAKELGLLKRVKTTAESLSDIYYSKGAYQSSADYLKISNQMNDSLARIERYNEIAKLEMRFEIEKKETEISKQKLIRNSFIAGAILFIIIGIILLQSNRRKRKDNKLLSKQKAEIQEISKQLQESDKRKLDFFTNISHEIRTPLTLIKSPLERILKADRNDIEIDSQLRIALKNTNKLKELINQILDMQKLDENLLIPVLSEFELISFCQETVSSFQGYCFQSNCSLKFDSNTGESFVMFDKNRLQSIINNLLSNAFKFNREGGFVQFNLDVKTDRIEIEIKDSGIGISKEHLKRIGERYYRVKESNSSIEGTGIGLAYVKELVQLMNGSFEISSIEDIGTSVIISLPCDGIIIQSLSPVSFEIKPKDKVFKELEDQISGQLTGLPSILIVEDNYDLRLFLCDLFSSSYQVICAKDGQEGMEMALKQIPDLIISDIMMPHIKGNELCRILKNDLTTSHITIILFTAKGSPDSIVDGYDCGADDYVVKPFDTDLLLKKVNNIITTGEQARKQFSFTDIERSGITYSEFDKKFLNDCISIIKNNIGNSDFTVELLAENVNIHRRTLLRKFKALTNKSPIDLIRHTRMTQAAELIRNKRYRVNEVALMVGYEDTGRFSQAFKNFHGVSPSSYS